MIVMALINFSGNVGSKVKIVQAPSVDTNKKQQVNSTYESTNNIKENNNPIEMELNINKLKELKSEILKKQNILKELEIIIIEKENKLKELEMNIIEKENAIANYDINNIEKTSFIKKIKKGINDFYCTIRRIIKKVNPFK